MDAKNRKAEALATELHLTETSLSERQAEVALLKGHERDYLQKIATLEVSAFRAPAAPAVLGLVHNAVKLTGSLYSPHLMSQQMLRSCKDCRLLKCATAGGGLLSERQEHVA